MNDPSFGGASATAVAQLASAMGKSLRRSVDNTKGISATVSQRAVHNLVDELAKDHFEALRRYSEAESEKVAAKAEQTAAKAAVKQERAEAALKINLTEQASQRSASFKQRLEAMESAGDELREEVAEWKSRAESAEEVLRAKEAKDNAIIELLEAEMKTLQDKRVALKKQLRNEVRRPRNPLVALPCRALLAQGRGWMASAEMWGVWAGVCRRSRLRRRRLRWRRRRRTLRRSTCAVRWCRGSWIW